MDFTKLEVKYSNQFDNITLKVFETTIIPMNFILTLNSNSIKSIILLFSSFCSKIKL